VGLSAVVYKNKRHLDLGSDEKESRLVPETGEIYFENEEISKKYRAALRATERQLGNMAEIIALREELTGLIGPESVILQKVVYSGTHCGDFLPPESIAALSFELNSISKTVGGSLSPELRRFVISLEELIRAAENEGNPIVFN
jgi:hypothetical protein